MKTIYKIRNIPQEMNEFKEKVDTVMSVEQIWSYHWLYIKMDNMNALQKWRQNIWMQHKS